MTISASEARRNLFPLIQQVNDDRIAIEITSKNGDAVLMAREDYESIMETLYLTRSQANAEIILRGLDDARAERGTEHELFDA